jgi:hypothetical protein
MDLKELMIWTYALYYDEYRSDFYTLTRTSLPPKPEKWGIYWNSCPLSKKEICFCYDIQPSSREDDYYEEFRFDSAQEALDFWNKHKDKLIKSV